MLTIRRLRRHAISESLFQPATLGAAVRQLGFVQADPIRAPARAQDLILRHRVKGYRVGDLEGRYSSLNLEEDVLYAYGFLPHKIWQLLHPRQTTGLTDLEKRILSTVHKLGPIHPRELETQFGRERVVNAWGGRSRATKSALESLHYRGLLRVGRRENGIRIYVHAPPAGEEVPVVERTRKLVALIAKILAPVPERSLQEALAPIRRSLFKNTRTLVQELIHTGELRKEMIEGVTYLWPGGELKYEEQSRRVRFLAPFDPVVWDRRRFEYLWHWPYRFEAYTPPAKRLRGYYAMPLLWGDRVIGWANLTVQLGELDVELGFVGRRPRNRDFRVSLEAEVSDMKTFLGLTSATAKPAGVGR
jgi:hypothetical protein